MSEVCRIKEALTAIKQATNLELDVSTLLQEMMRQKMFL